MSALLAFITTIALIIVSVTMLVRANDLRWKRGLSWRWNARLLGLMLSGFAPWGIILYKMFYPNDQDIVFYQTVFHVGLALVFVTTPGLPPWVELIFKGDHGVACPKCPDEA